MLRGRGVREASIAIASLVPALAAVFAVRGFTVDDAWIPAKYAANLVRGGGWSFVYGHPSDGVTPLPWVPILAFFGGGSVHRGVVAARLLGVAAWSCSVVLLATYAARRDGSRFRFLPLVSIVAAPFAAWSVAGLETGVVTLLATLAATARSPSKEAIAAGAVAAFRPETLPMAVVLGAHAAMRAPKRLAIVATAVGPWIAIALVRLVAFGHAFPLAVVAKPPDPRLGLDYVVAGLLLAGPPALALAPRTLSRRDAQVADVRAKLVAAVVHALAVAFAGGDWMPLSRLLVPSLPLFLVAAIDVAALARPLATTTRAVFAIAGIAWTWYRAAPSISDVMPAREALVLEGKSLLASSRVVAALDVGWTSEAFEGPIVDLAGLTERAIAELPGGHTSKRVTGAMLAARGVDTLVFLRERGCEGACVREDGGPYERAVEERLIHDAWVEDRFRVAGEIRGGPLVYVVLRASR